MVVAGYNDWLTKERLEETEAEWAQMDRGPLLQKIEDFEPKSVIEFCCGTGWIPKGLNEATQYIGIDANPGCIDLAAKKNPEPTRTFVLQDVRTFEKPSQPLDMALAFSCLKHFKLADWDRVYGSVLDAGKHTLCSVYLAEEDREDPGYGYPHTAVSREHLERVLGRHGHEILDVFVLPPLVGSKEPLVLTRHVPDEEFGL